MTKKWTWFKQFKKQIFYFGLCLFVCAHSTFVLADDGRESDALFEPDVTPREVDIDDIDTENFEIGLYGGVLSVEDFESNFLYGLNLRYHVSEDFFLEANVASSTAGKTSYERLSGAASLLTEDEREILYYNLTFGFNLFPGEAFVARSWAFNSRFYLLGGLGSTDFAGDQRLTLNIGFGYQVLPTDWLAIHFQAKDHVFDLDVLGVDKTTHNIELSSGLSIYF